MLRIKIIEAAIIQSIMAWFNRLITVVTAVFLARILNPEDFGLLAIAMAVMSILDGFTTLGLNAGLIINDDDEIVDDDYNVAWTYGYFVRGILLFFLIFFISDWIALFYNTNELSLVLKVLSIQQIFYAFSNIWLIEYYRKVEYRKDFIISIISQFARILTVIPLAIYLKNIWALVAGLLVKSFVGLILQYSIVQKRPRLNFNFIRFQKLFLYSIPIIGVQIVTILKNSIDKVLLGKLLGVSQLGYYQIASRFGFELPSEIKNVVSKIMFPSFSRIKNSKERLKTGFINVLTITFIVSIPFCAFLFINTNNIVLVLLGDKWVDAIPAMRILVVAGFFQITHSILNPLYKGVGKPKFEFYVSLFQSVLAIGLIIILTNKYGIIGTAYSMLFALFLPLFASWIFLKKILNIKFSEILISVFYPTILGILICTSSLYFNYNYNALPWKVLLVNTMNLFAIIFISGYFLYKKVGLESLVLLVDGIKKLKR